MCQLKGRSEVRTVFFYYLITYALHQLVIYIYVLLTYYIIIIRHPTNIGGVPKLHSRHGYEKRRSIAALRHARI